MMILTFLCKKKTPFFNGVFLAGGEGDDPFKSRLPGGDRLFLGLLLFAFIGFLFSPVLSYELTMGIAPSVPTRPKKNNPLKFLRYLLFSSLCGP
jgi:hypothetical protein